MTRCSCKNIIFVLTGILTSFAIAGCSFDKLAFPVVQTDVPVESPIGKLEVHVGGSFDVDGMSDEVVIDQGFVWSSMNPLPNVEEDNVVLVERREGSTTFIDTLRDPSFNHSVDQYYIRAFVRLVDDNRDTYITSEAAQRFSFKSKLTITNSFFSIDNDKVTTSAFFEYSDPMVPELLDDHGHIYSTDSGDDINSCAPCVVRLGDELQSDNQFSTSYNVNYNTGYYVTPFVIIDGDVAYGEETFLPIAGGINRSTDYPMSATPLQAGIGTSTGENASSAFVGVGDALFRIRESGIYGLEYSEIALPDELSGSYLGGSAVSSDDRICIYAGADEDNGFVIDSLIQCYDLNSETWESYDPRGFGFSSRFETIAFLIEDKAYFAFGRNLSNVPMSDVLEFDMSSSKMRRFNPPTEVLGTLIDSQYAAAAAVVEGSAYIFVGYDGEDEDPHADQRIVKFTPDGGRGIWESVAATSEVSPATRIRAFAFALNNQIYFGQGVAPVGSFEAFQDIWRFDVSSQKWSEVSNVPASARSNAVGFALNGRGYFGYGEPTFTINGLPDIWVITPGQP